MTVLVEKNVPMAMRDGVKLAADIYRPVAKGKYPVLLQRTPYNKELWPITALCLDPIRAAAAGYVIAIQDVRARWASEGEVFFPYRDEQDDGFDSIDWMTAQPYSSGKVGCYGLSYMGGTSWLAAASGHQALGAISPTTAPNDFWRNHFWRGGALNLGTLAMWAMRAIGPAALIRSKPDLAEMVPMLVKLIDDVDAFGDVLTQLPLCEFEPTRPGDESFLPFFYEFLKHPVPDDWTRSMLLGNRHSEVSVPSLIIAGWHDLLLASDLEHFAGMRENAGSAQAREQTKLIIGPWSHGSFQHVVGDVDFGFRSNGMFLDLKEDLTKLQLRWFDRWLKGERNGIDEEAPVKLFVQGENRWRDESSWPPARAENTTWFLHNNASLQQSAPSAEQTPISYVYDPNDPCPTRGGGSLLPPQYAPGPLDQTPILKRSDVILLRSAVLEADLEITGEVNAVLYASTSGRDTDWVMKLCDVHPDGKIIGVCDGVLRASFRNGESRELVEPQAIVRYDISLWSTSMLFKAGHRIAVIVTSSDFPRYDRNPNTGESPHTASKLEAALQKIYVDAAHASHITLPVIAR